jgi:aldehyde:ferredoxin oxidoreductase
VKKRVQEYYEEASWDLNGIPKSETLTRLGLEKVDRALEKLRKT